ncbi:F0F1 ATP synthase subunit B' [uncultured Algimonas sp.]|uniref:F0F1 ATP synthase subunit B family protein n=1 Tax=uncultured Algimonas sp. TaxID=1547920 RepID=UPI00260AB448|nr:F0F1 ATP synthase subunit B' [uncultured Algimonas sp.]
MAAEETYTDAELAADAASGLPQLDTSTWVGQIFWLFLTFAILYFALSKFILPRLRDTLGNRSDRIADDLDSASRMKLEAEEAEKAHEQSLRDARAKASNVAESTRQSLDAEIRAELDEADAQAERESELAEARIRDIKTAALSNIDAVAVDVAGTLVNELTGKTIAPAKVTAALKGARS